MNKVQTGSCPHDVAPGPSVAKSMYWCFVKWLNVVYRAISQQEGEIKHGNRLYRLAVIHFSCRPLVNRHVIILNAADGINGQDEKKAYIYRQNLTLRGTKRKKAIQTSVAASLLIVVFARWGGLIAMHMEEDAKMSTRTTKCWKWQHRCQWQRQFDLINSENKQQIPWVLSLPSTGKTWKTYRNKQVDFCDSCFLLRLIVAVLS